MAVRVTICRSSPENHEGDFPYPPEVMAKMKVYAWRWKRGKWDVVLLDQLWGPEAEAAKITVEAGILDLVECNARSSHLVWFWRQAPFWVRALVMLDVGMILNRVRLLAVSLW